VEVQPQLSSGRRRGARISRCCSFRTASGVLAHINTNWLTPFKARKRSTVATRGKYVMGDLLTRQVNRNVFGLQARTAAIRCVICPSAMTSRCGAELIAFPRRPVRSGGRAPR